MRQIKLLRSAVIPLAALGLAGTFATATLAVGVATENSSEISDFLQSPMSLADAIRTAETDTGAKAMDASSDLARDGSARFGAELAKADGTVMAVLVEAGTGVATLKQANADQHEDNG